ncbi:YeiH family protein [Clostridium tarantellae]|uniref:Putative sulfate exporter family transporter n=1 Tax=Clostridium tarantellae TaxID=39493 RepID=A0A6I1MRH6_9CLOT|nr:putative sulfate exporter family transporter [Clostridium tarantellae]MPQ45078.1 putative sulfate exporter family transporter [Clostridium tarantellae]
MKKTKEIIPGFIVCVFIAMIGKFLASFMPSLGAATFAIFLGIIAGNTILNNKRYDEGSKFSERELLSYSIVLMGATLQLSDIKSVGLGGVVFIVLQMIFTISSAFIIGRKLGFNRKFSLLMSAGNAVCGSSAIASVSQVVHPNAKDKGLSVTIVNVTGTILMFVLPIVAGIMYNHETIQTSALLGGTLQSVGQVIASAQFVNESVVEMATIFKILRIILIVAVVILFSRVNTSEEGKLFEKKYNNGKKVKVTVPWFIIGFFILSVIYSLGLIPKQVSSVAHYVSGQFEIIALAAIGMRVKFKDLIKEGPKGMLYGGLVGLMQIIFALVLIKIFI